MVNNNQKSPVAPIRASLAAIEVVDGFEKKNSTKQSDHFVVVSVDDKEISKSEKKPSRPAPRWEWTETQQLWFHPSSTIKIIIYCKNRIPTSKRLIGQHTGLIVELLENNTTTDLKDQTGARIAKIKINLSLAFERLDAFGSFMETMDSNISCLANTVRAPVVSSLGMVLHFTKNIMDLVADAHPILKASWAVLSVVYRAIQQAQLQDDTVRALAENLRETLGIAKEYPDLLLITGTTNVIEEIGRISLHVASLIHEYTRHSFTGRTVKYQLSNDMKSRIAQYQESCDDLKRKFDRRINIETNRQMKKIRNDQLTDKIYQWLSAPDSSKNYHEARKKHQADTGSWFLDGERFREFQAKTNFLWIRGKAGCGKTILSSSIVKKIQEIHKENKSTYYAYFFFDGRDSQKDLQLHENLIRSLILQLSHQCDDIPISLVELYGQGYQQPSTRSLEDTLYYIIDRLDSTYIIIDSLDECIERETTLQWINRIVSCQMDSLHMVVASRPERDIIDALQRLDQCCVDFANESSNHDITLYLEQQLSAVKKWDEDTQVIIKTRLMERAEGMFRWVAIQLMELKKCSNRRSVIKQLDSLPKDLYETYDRILLKIDQESDRIDTKTILRWLCFSIRPMELGEIAETLTVDFDSESGPKYTPSHRYWDERDVLEKCSGLITESEGVVKLAHFSIKEYLLSERISMGSTSSFHLGSEDLSHSLIAQTCLAYLLQFDVFPSSSTFKLAPLAEYAAEHWTIHARSGGIDKSEQSVTWALAKELLTPDGTAFMHWVRIWNLDQRYKRNMKSPERTEFPSPLYYASLAGLRHVVQHLLEQGDPNVQEGLYGNALQAASYMGSEAVVKLLVEKGADINAWGGYYGNALQAASVSGHEAIAKLLLRKGADVNAQGGLLRNALYAASVRGHEPIAKLLLEKGVDANALAGLYGNALQAALARGHEAIAKLLLEKGADVNVQGGYYGNALQAASARGHEGTAKLLLKKGADVNAQGGAYGNALQAASAEGYGAIAELLLEKCASVNAQGGEYGNALQAASAKGYKAITQLLLEKGADTNAQGGKYANALLAASARGHEEIVNLLLENRADVNAQGGTYGSALQAASAEGYKVIAKLLLEKGANVNAQGGEYGNALQAASAGEHVSIVKLLVEEGADVDAKGGLYGNALQAASTKGNDVIAKLLLEKGADVNAHAGYYGNALQTASARGHKAVAKFLLENGADVNARGGKYDNPLQAASAEGHKAIAQLLLEKGANVNIQGGYYGNALQTASARGHEAIVELLLEKGADVNACGGKYANALQAASVRGHERVVKLLLGNGADRSTLS